MLPTQPSLRLPATVLVAVTAFFAVLAHSASARAADSVSLEVANRINALRVQHGLQPMTIDGRLNQAGRAQSSAMMSRRSLSHGNPDGRARLTRTFQDDFSLWLQRWQGPGAQCVMLINTHYCAAVLGERPSCRRHWQCSQKAI